MCLCVPTQAIEYNLAEEAFDIYKKFNKKVEAIKVLLEHIPEGGLQRAVDFAQKVDEAPVYSELGHAQLKAGQVGPAIASYLKANDSSNYMQVRGHTHPRCRNSLSEVQPCGTMRSSPLLPCARSRLREA